MKCSFKIITGLVAVAFGAAQVASASTLDDVKARGALKCGISGGVPGFSSPNDAGRMVGIDAAVCDAVAAAVLGDASKVTFIPLTAKERFTALSSGEVDVLSRNTTHTLTREASLGLNFTYYNYIDGQGFMVKKDSGIKSALELDGASICVQAGTTTELNMADYFRNNKMDFKPVGYETSTQTREGFEGGACDVLTSDKSQLAALRTEMKNPNNATLLPETISKEPLGPVVRQGDDQWMDIVAFTLYALINAEELGITSKNVDEMKSNPPSPSVARILGTEGNTGELLGLGADWAYNAIKQVGNYGEIYANTVEPIGIPRAGSVNDLWTRGGILYAPPVR
ncbi:amino acid ABC transporter substrate-binding protein [Litorivicinus sp.]|jgi:general L-amino acid transport system substrate-binding protein|nr:amino acid ABC transporter substrate-binding protein [Litorivicinus sp.]MDC1208189.1 amino acid ABC transporter substrate-binding protein [Litorivicinus sp.]MDC1240819.1 amino acid ABC transporter substrate-binding protein [Litorivicinus sp.]MDC1319608.1 amino acid ABC transporter substrate-binding protein [Litorivicinus sp.]